MAALRCDTRQIRKTQPYQTFTHTQHCQRRVLRRARNPPQTLSSAIAELPLHRRHVLLFFCCALQFLRLGFIDALGFAFNQLETTFGPQSPGMLAAVPCSCLVGLAVSFTFAGALSDRYGRLSVSHLAMIFGLVAQLLVLLAPSLHALIIFLFLSGVLLGVSHVSLPALLTECLPARYERLLVLYQLSWPIGAIAYCLSLHHWSWRFAFIPSILASCALLLLLHPRWGPVESPRYLFVQGREREAKIAFAALGGTQEFERFDSDTSQATKEANKRCQTLGTLPGRMKLFIFWSILGGMCQGFATQNVKVWLPLFLERRHVLVHGTAKGSLAFASMWAIEIAGQALSVVLAAGEGQKLAAGGRGFPQIALASSLLAAGSVLGAFLVKTPAAAVAIGGLHLICQANLYNFLLAFATTRFPVPVRARCVALYCQAAFLGSVIGPYVGSRILKSFPACGQEAVIILAGASYILGVVSCIGVLRTDH